MKKFLLILFTAFTSYFAQAQIVKVNAAATGANDGTSWTDAYTDLQTAIANTSSGQIWVVAGTYYPGTSGSNSAAFQLKNNVQILGGFNGTEGGPTFRNPAVNVTILSGDLNQSTTLDGSDAYHVVISYNEDSTAVLDGFTITGGNAAGGNIWDFTGGGFSHQPSGSGALNPIIRNCTFTGNTATEGAAIAVVNWNVPSSNVRTQIINCKVLNHSNVGNGAIFTECQGSGSFISSKFENVLIANNTSASGTTALLIEHANGGRSDVQFIGCTIANNTTSGYAIEYRTYSGPGTLNFKNCILQDANVSTDGSLYADNSNVFNVGSFTGTNNISSNPLFVNPALGDFHLQCASPSINFGENSFTTEVVDLDNYNRINGIVDMGVYETNYTMPTVSANVNPSSTICAGDFISLYGSGANTYTWTGGVLDGVFFAPSVTDTYTVTGTDANGCVNTASITVTVNPLPTISIGYTSNIICLGSSVLLFGIGGVNYAWTHGVNDNVAFSPTTTETYTVTGIDANGCQAIDQITVTVESTATVSAGTDYDVCKTNASILTNGNDGGFGNGVWTTSGDGSFDDVNLMVGSTYTFGSGDMASNSVVLMLMVTPAACPVYMSSVTITLKDSTSAYAGGDISYCSGVISGANLSASTTNSSGIIWSSTGTGSFSSNTSINSIYTFSPADNAGGIINIGLESIPANAACPHAFDTLSINIHPLPTVNLGADLIICATDSFLLQGNVTGGTAPYNYVWKDGNAASISFNNSDYYTPSAGDTYQLYVSDIYGCANSDTMYVARNPSTTIAGNAYLNSTPISDGKAYLFRVNPFSLLFDTAAVYTIAGGTGFYNFGAVPFGNYKLKVIADTLLYPTSIPTYYGGGFQWDSAGTITHNCISPFIADVNLNSLLGGTGTGRITGHLIEDVGFGARVAYNGHDHVMAPGGPLKGIDVKLGKNPGGGIQARTMSDTTGFYHFDSIPNDSYRIYVDIPGLGMDSFYVVNINSTNDTLINLDYHADDNSIYPILNTNVGLHPYTSEAAVIFNMYPNPAKNYTSLLFTSEKQNNATVHVMDITGKQVMNVSITNLPKGKHEYQLNFTNQQLESGIYFVELINENGKQVKKLIVE